MATDSAGNTLLGRTSSGKNIITGGSTRSLSSDIGGETAQDYLNQYYEPQAKTIMESYEASRGKIGEAAQAGRELIQSQYAGNKMAAEEQGARTIQGEREGSRGFAANTALLRSYADETRKRVSDLERNKNELLLQNKMAEASEVSDLILKEQKALTDARTNFLSEYFDIQTNRRAEEMQGATLEQMDLQNKLALSGEERAMSAEERAQAQEARNAAYWRTPEQEAVLAMAQSFADAGITENDTLESAQVKIRGSNTYLQNQRQAEAQIEQIKASTAASYASAEANRALASERLGGVQGVNGNEVAFTDINGQTKSAKVSDLTASIMNGLGTLKDLTPTDKKTVLAEMQKIGYNPKQNVVDRMSKLLELWAAVPEDMKGPVEGRLYSIGGYGANLSPKVAAFESARIPIVREIARMYDVGMLSDQDVADYKSAVPSLNDANGVVAAAKINGLTTAMITPSSQAQKDLSFEVAPSSSTPTTAWGGTTASGLSFTVIPD